MGQAKINLNVGAIKDDYFAAATSGLTEDKLFTSLNVLADAPKAAHIVGLMTTVTDLPDAKGPLFAYSANGAMVSLDADGNVLYSGENFKAMLDSLAQGEVFKDSFAYMAQLGNGVMSPASATLEIAGVNDAPRAYDYKAFIQDGEGNDSFPIWKGIWHATDPDHGAVIHFLPQKIEGGLFNGGISADGAFSLVPNTALINGLHEGELASFSMMVTAVDEFGAKGTGTIAVLIEGANDLAEITGPEEVKIDLAAQTSVDGVLQVADLDYGEAVFGTIASSQTPKSGSQDGVLTAEGDYGVLTMNAATGAWHYTANSRITAPEGVDYLKDVFYFTSLDHTAKFNLTITLLDAPTTIVGVPIDWNDSNYS